MAVIHAEILSGGTVLYRLHAPSGRVYQVELRRNEDGTSGLWLPNPGSGAMTTEDVQAFAELLVEANKMLSVL